MATSVDVYMCMFSMDCIYEWKLECLYIYMKLNVCTIGEIFWVVKNIWNLRGGGGGGVRKALETCSILANLRNLNSW